jgi:hypothetical protein
MTRRIKLPKELVIRCYALCRQAERSLDRALRAPWAEFAAYYGPDRLSALETVAARLEAELPQPAVSHAPPRFEEVYRQRALGKAFGLLLGKLGIFRKTTFAFREPEVRFVLAKLQALVNLLGRKERPAQEEIIASRMAMYDCQRLLEGPCYGLPELARANRVEHFLYPEHWQPVKLEELVG